MASPAGTLELLAHRLGTALALLEERLGEGGADTVFADIGLLLPEGMSSQADLAAALGDAVTAAADLRPLIDTLAAVLGSDDAAAITSAGAAVVSQVVAVVGSLDDVGSGLDAASASFGGLTAAQRATIAAFAADLPRRLAEYLIVEYAHERAPQVLAALGLFGLVDRSHQDGGTDGIQPPYTRRELHLERLGDLISDPSRHFLDLYGWGSPTFDGRRLLEGLHGYITEHLGRTAVLLSPPGLGTVLEAYLFSVFTLDSVNPPALAGSLRFPGNRDYERTYPLDGPWELVVEAGGRFAADMDFRIDPPLDFDLTPPDGTVVLTVSARLVAESDADPLLVVGQAGGTRLEAQRAVLGVGFTAVVDTTGAHGEPTAEAELRGGRLVIDATEADGFIQSILSGARVDAPFEFGALWRPSTGLVINGGAGTELAFPTNVELGLVTVNALFVRLGFSTEAPVTVGLTAAFTTRLGPLTATVDRMGTTFAFALPPDRRGNLGPVDLRAGFQPPVGLGLSVDGGGFKGGGFLSFDPAEERYTGALELEFEDTVTIKAIGLLTTRLPGGETADYSLLIVISVEFAPVQLGYGFTLNGVGGVLGLNRTVRVDSLKTGIRDNTLESILFPNDVVANASRIISDLNAVYPPATDRFVFGPMAEIGWGTPPVITVTLGLVIEVPDPVRVVIPGIVRATIPSDDFDLLRLQVNFVGGVDFQKQTAFFDASIYDSRLLSFPLSGDMAFRLRWGEDPNFLLTVGGFHPAYQPPPMALPDIRRLTVQLLSGTNPRLVLETYFAITSNSVQFGAKVELLASAGPFNVYGFLGFDVLFEFDPFRFVAEVKAMLALRRGSSSIASISLSLSLEGPTPWRVTGTAKLKLFWFLTVRVKVSKTFGDELDTRLEDIEVLPLVRAAFEQTGNWQALLPPRSHLLVSLRDTGVGDDAIVAHPFGVLTVSQKVTPLNVKIDRFGHRRPSDADTFAISNVRSGGDALETRPLKEHFAPAQFFDRTDSEKLSSASFEHYDSGVTIAGSEELRSDHYARRDVEFELSYVDSQRDLPPTAVVFVPDLEAFDTWAVAGAVADSPLSFAKTRISALAPEAVRVTQERYRVVGVDDLVPFDGMGPAASEGEARAQMNALLGARPGLDGRIQVVPDHEVAVA